jgi:hypothetical protein
VRRLLACACNTCTSSNAFYWHARACQQSQYVKGKQMLFRLNTTYTIHTPACTYLHTKHKLLFKTQAASQIYSFIYIIHITCVCIYIDKYIDIKNADCVAAAGQQRRGGRGEVSYCPAAGVPPMLCSSRKITSVLRVYIKYVWMYVCMYVCICMRIYACEKVCMYVCMGVNVVKTYFDGIRLHSLQRQNTCICARPYGLHVMYPYICMHVWKDSMCVYPMCVCIWEQLYALCTCLCVHVCIRTCMRACVCVCMYVWSLQMLYVYVNACMHVYSYACMHVYSYACMHACMHVICLNSIHTYVLNIYIFFAYYRMPIYMYICIYVYM